MKALSPCEKKIVEILESPKFGFEIKEELGFDMTTRLYIRLRRKGVLIRRTKFASLFKSSCPSSKYDFKINPKKIFNSYLYYLEGQDLFSKLKELTGGYAYTKTEFLSRLK
ncbi:MAG: hypothetical protein ACE5K4_10940 [Candidatus Hydrothermarchaeota archaeon]